jgi:site-specific recombinase XerD
LVAPVQAAAGGTGSREEAFWERYRQVVRTARVEDGVAVWYRRHVEGFIRFLKPRRLREAEATDVSAFLWRMHRQEDPELWQVKQADKALRLLYPELVKVAWAERFVRFVRDGKGAKDRVTMLPGSAEESLRAHLQGVRSPLDGG